MRRQLDDVGTMSVQNHQHRRPVGPIGNAEKMLPLRAVRPAFGKGSDPWIRQRCDKQESVEHAVEKAPAPRGQCRPTALKQSCGVGRKEERLKKEVSYHRAALGFIVQRFHNLLPARGAIGRLFQKTLTEQTHGAMPSRQICAFAILR